jgi:hypothetical protein
MTLSGRPKQLRDSADAVLPDTPPDFITAQPIAYSFLNSISTALLL